MNINLEKVDKITLSKYEEFKNQVQECLSRYEKTDKEKIDLVKEKLKRPEIDWDASLNLQAKDTEEKVDVSVLLAYEYCKASERITKGKVKFEDMLDKLFEGVTKFKIGNPKPGIDDECIYGKSVDDETAMPVTSKKYRLLAKDAGAQHLTYVREGKLKGAIFLYPEEVRDDLIKDSNGNPMQVKTNGINFYDLREGQSLLTNLRQTVFHEWNHNAEKEKLENAEETIPYEYQSEDGKLYRNYQKINEYVEYDTSKAMQEPDYICETFKTIDGERREYYFENQDGQRWYLNASNFGLEKSRLDSELCISIGLTTTELLPNGKTVIHNQVTEGFVEKTARAMVKAIDPDVKDIDEGKYADHVAVADTIINSRDKTLEEGQTFTDFLMHSTQLKKDLETRVVTLGNGQRTDGLHYISDFINASRSGNIRKAHFFKRMNKVAQELGLTEEQIVTIQQSDLWHKKELTEDEQESLRDSLIAGNDNNKDLAEGVVSEFVDILQQEKEFYEGIPDKLGYEQREDSKTTTQLYQEILKEMKDVKLLDKLQGLETHSKEKTEKIAPTNPQNGEDR